MSVSDEFGKVMSSWECDEFGRIFITHNGLRHEVDAMQFGVWLESMEAAARQSRYRMARELERIRELE